MDHSRQSSLIEYAVLTREYHIIGCGGIGSWIAFFLAKAGCTNLYLWDGDNVEVSNLHRTPYRESHIGMNKAEALREILLETFGEHTEHNLIALGEWIKGVPIRSNLRRHPVVVFCAVDGMQLRQEIRHAVFSEGGYYVDVGAEANGGNVSSSPAEWELETAAPREYFTPIWIAPCVVIAALTVWCLLRQPIWDAWQEQPYPYLRFDEKLIVGLLAGRRFEETGQAGTAPIRNVGNVDPDPQTTTSDNYEDEESEDFEDDYEEEEAPF